MKLIENNKGIALITALMLTLISLIIILALLSYINQGTYTSAAQKQYRNSLEAANGGVDLIAKEILPDIQEGMTGTTLATNFSAIGLNVYNGNCLSQKLTLTDSSEWTDCIAGYDTSDPTEATDVSFLLQGTGGGSSGYKIYAKVVDSTPGNSDTSGIDYLAGGGGVTSTTSGLSPKHEPGLYRLEIQGEKQQNPKERALLSVLYAY